MLSIISYGHLMRTSKGLKADIESLFNILKPVHLTLKV